MSEMNPKGCLIAIGGAEDRDEEKDKGEKNKQPFDEGILEQIVEIAGKREKPCIEIITTASGAPEKLAATYDKAFRKLGVTNVQHLPIDERDGAMDEKTLKRLEKCNTVFFTGGDQERLCAILGGSKALELIKQKYFDDHLTIAGTSAGAAAMSSTIILNGSAEDAYKKGTVKLSLGFGFIKNVIIDTHFDARGRLGRIIQAVAAQPGTLAIGLSEDTAVVFKKGSEIHALGSSSVIVLDGSTICRNNIYEIDEGVPLTVSNIQLHALSRGDIFDIKENRVKKVGKV